MHRMTILHDTHHNRVSQTAPVDVHDSWTGDQCGEGFGDMGVCVLVSGFRKSMMLRSLFTTLPRAMTRLPTNNPTLYPWPWRPGAISLTPLFLNL